ncbi:MAG: hypothetical protein ACI4VI_09910 [Acutalibacteraceae bacterium]
MRKKVLFFFCFLFSLFLNLFYFFYYRSNCKFPVFNPDIFTYICLLITIIPTVFFFVMCFTNRSVSKVISIVLILIIVVNAVDFTEILRLRYKISLIYDFYSETTDSSNYLIIDDYSFVKDEALEKLKKIFPEKIPDSASEIQYNYYADSSSEEMQIETKWTLPEEDYQTAKANAKGYPCSINEIDYFSCTSEEYYIVSAFDDAKHTVEYIFLCGKSQGSEYVVEGLDTLYDW